MLLRRPSLSRGTRDGLGIGIMHMHAQGQLALTLGSWEARCCAETLTTVLATQHVANFCEYFVISPERRVLDCSRMEPPTMIKTLGISAPSQRHGVLQLLSAGSFSISSFRSLHVTSEQPPKSACINNGWVFLRHSGRRICVTTNLTVPELYNDRRETSREHPRRCYTRGWHSQHPGKW